MADAARPTPPVAGLAVEGDRLAALDVRADRPAVGERSRPIIEQTFGHGGDGIGPRLQKCSRGLISHRTFPSEVSQVVPRLPHGWNE